MEPVDFYKTNEELKKEIQKNNKIINENDERKRMAYVNQFDYKLWLVIGFSMFSYLGLITLTGILSLSGILLSIVGIISSAESFPLIITGSSLCMGFITKRIFEKKYNTKERFKAFSEAKTESEKIQEEVKYTIELEKANNRNTAIGQAMSLLSSSQSILNSLSSRYNINDKTLPQNEEEAKKRVEDLSITLRDKYNELDVLTTQKVLHDKFWNVRIKVRKVMDTILCSVIGGLLVMCVTMAPFILLRDYITPNLISEFALYIITSVSVGGYMIKRNKDYMKAFNNLNKNLGENALSDNIKDAYEEYQDINEKIKNKINEVSSAEIQLQEQKRAMESFSNNNSTTEESIKLSKSAEHINEDLQNNTIFGYNQANMMPLPNENTFVTPEKESSLTLKMK